MIFSMFIHENIQKREGSFRTKVGDRSFFEGDVSRTARKRPLILSIEDVEAPRATNLLLKNLKTAALSLTSIRQHC
jgi:hypothetical protein